MSILNKIFKSYSEKEVKRVRPIVEKINSLESEMEKLSDTELVAKTDYFKKQLKEGKLKRILLIATGALMNSTSMQQGETIPGIAHAISIEM